MIGTIRKHSKWLWWFIAGLTIISFIYWGAGPTARSGGGRAAGDFGRIYGHKITREDYIEARNEYFIFNRIHYGEWPDKNPNLSQDDLQRQIYLHLLFDLKAADLGIYVSREVAAQAAAEMLRSFARNGQTVPPDAFVNQLLQPEGFTADDFERYVRHDLIIQQLIQTTGLPGELVTPQEAVAEYERERREYSVQAVFFSASNYLSAVAVQPAAVAQFYTNDLAVYRLPDRVQVSYVEFNVSNYLAQAKAQWAKTNFDEVIEANYRQLGPDYFPDAKTPEAAKAKVRELLIRNRALADANQQANDFANAVFAQATNGPANPELLALAARQQGLTVHRTAPFASAFGPDEFAAPAEFTKAAFSLTPEEPFAGPVLSRDAVYILALLKQLPSEIPSLAQIHDRVTEDYRLHEATLLAQRAGTNFYFNATTQMAAGKTFAQVAVAAGLRPQALPPFSLITQDLSGMDDRAELNQLKQAAFGTPVGHTSDFMETRDGGLVLYVQSQLPVDQAAMNSQMPQFIAQLRRTRQNEAFNEWLQIKASRELRNTPAIPSSAASRSR